MKNNSVITAIFCGLSVAWVALDIFPKVGWLFFIILPILSVTGLWLAEIIGKKYPFVLQFGKFGLAGGFADVVDIKVFQLLYWLVPFSLAWKVVSFFAGTLVKYFFDKHWTFQRPEKENMHKEMAMFFMVAIVGSVINVAAFYCATKIIGVQLGMSEGVWREISIILAAVVTAGWNFLGYKFLVFKK
jgi:putative flippase GtrA